jgi:putative PIN family toxin of toxin-antitoxin system
MKIVLDSGVWVSALEFGGIPADALVKARTQDQIIFCVEIENEIVDTLQRKFGRAPERSRALLEPFLLGSHGIVVKGQLSGICRDPKDDFILECANTGNADCIATGDKDLLSLDPYGDIRILTPGNIWTKPSRRFSCKL